jgi:hypothetical protein
MKISYCLSVADEEHEFRKLYENIRINKRDEDNIIVLVDLNKCDSSSELLGFLHRLSSSNYITLIEDRFNGHFGNWKNKLIDSPYSDGDFLVFLDADERLPPQLIDDLPLILELNPTVNIIGLARQNFVKGITQEDIQKWGWKIDELNRINWSDIQYRIIRNNSGIRWEGQIHETLVGPGIKTTLPIEPEYAILHCKTIEKQRLQNNRYRTGDYSK